MAARRRAGRDISMTGSADSIESYVRIVHPTSALISHYLHVHGLQPRGEAGLVEQCALHGLFHLLIRKALGSNAGPPTTTPAASSFSTHLVLIRMTCGRKLERHVHFAGPRIHHEPLRGATKDKQASCHSGTLRSC